MTHDASVRTADETAVAAARRRDQRAGLADQVAAGDGRLSLHDGCLTWTPASPADIQVRFDVDDVLGVYLDERGGTIHERLVVVTFADGTTVEFVVDQADRPADLVDRVQAILKAA